MTADRESAESIVRGRLAELPECLRDVARACAPRTPARDAFVVTGIGASEAPARMMAELLRATWRAPASFVPLSAFASGSPRVAGDALVIFSQGLSPNARLAIERAGEFARAALFTSVRADPSFARFEARGGELVIVPSASEQGTLVRILGPAAAMLASALYTGAVAANDVDGAIDAISRASARVADVEPAPAGSVAFVAAGGYGELCRAAQNAWLEALCAPEPPMWDVLQVAHGPFQQFFDSKMLLVALERDGAERDLFDRLARLLVPGRHTLVRLRSSLPAPLAALDHLAQVFELVCRTLRAHPRDLAAWPGSGRDGPLYDLGRPDE